MVKQFTIDYKINNPLHIKRWMCEKCGLVFDFQFSPSDPGWTTIETDIDNWKDENGHYHQIESDEPNEFCPRCNTDFSKLPLIPIVVDKFSFGNFVKTLFVVEDYGHEKVVLEIAKCVQKDIAVVQADNAQNVKTFFDLAKSQGELDYVYFLVDGDNKSPDKKYIKETHFIHLEKYCIENYLLDFEICSKISAKSKNEVKLLLLESIQGKSKNLLKSNNFGQELVKILKTGDLKPGLLSYMDASEVTKEFSRKLGFPNEDVFFEKYVTRCHQTSRLGRVFPKALVMAIKNSKIKPLPKI